MASQYEKRKAKEKDEALQPDIESLPLDRTAYDVYWDDEQRKFVRVILEYNLTSRQGRVKETKAIADSQPVAIYKMGEAMNRKVLKLPPKEE